MNTLTPNYNSGNSGSGRFTLQPDEENKTQVNQTKTITVRNEDTNEVITFTFTQKAPGIVFGITDGKNEWDGSSIINIAVPSSQGVTEALRITTPNDLQVEYQTGSGFTTPSTSTITTGQNKSLSFNYSQNNSGYLRVDTWKVGSAKIIITQYIGPVAYNIYTTVPTYVYRTDKTQTNADGQYEPEIMGKTTYIEDISKQLGNFKYKLEYHDDEDSLTGEIPITFGNLGSSYKDYGIEYYGPQHIHTGEFVFDKNSQNETYSQFDAAGFSLEYNNDTLSRSARMIVVNSEGREYIPYNFNGDYGALNHITSEEHADFDLYAIDDFFECQKYYVPLPYNPFTVTYFQNHRDVSVITAHCNADTYIPFTDSKYSVPLGSLSDFKVNIEDTPSWITVESITDQDIGQNKISDIYRTKRIRLHIAANTQPNDRTAKINISRTFTYESGFEGSDYDYTYTISTSICINQLGTNSVYHTITFDDQEFSKTGYCPSGIVKSGSPLYLKACHNILNSSEYSTGLPDRYVARWITQNNVELTNIVEYKKFQDTDFYESFVCLVTNSVSSDMSFSTLVNKVCEQNIGYVIQSGGDVSTNIYDYPNRLLYNMGDITSLDQYGMPQNPISYPGNGQPQQHDIVFYSAKGLSLQLATKLVAFTMSGYSSYWDTLPVDKNWYPGTDCEKINYDISSTDNSFYGEQLNIHSQFIIGKYTDKVNYKFKDGSSSVFMANVFGLVYEVNTTIPE